MRYFIEMLPTADRALERMERGIRHRILVKLSLLQDHPRPTDVVKLRGHHNRWRVRVGAYRIVYEIHDERLVIVVIDIPHRGAAY